MARQSTESSELDHQPSLQQFKSVLLIISVILILLVVISIVLWVPYRIQATEYSKQHTYEILQLPPGEKLLQMQQQHLNAYEWLDRDRQIARIPVEQAMHLLVEYGSKPFFHIDAKEVPHDDRRK